MIDATINDISVSVPEGTTILCAAREVGIEIPSLCHLDLSGIKMVNQFASCRVCVVEAEGRRNLLPACSTPLLQGMAIRTNSQRAIRTRRAMVELLLSNHPHDCLVCERNGNCELQALAARFGIHKDAYQGHRNSYVKDFSSEALVRNPEKCVLCRRCETMCNEVQTVGVYSAVHRGFDTVMGTAFDLPMADTSCVNCGQCVSVCPTAALTETDRTADVWKLTGDPGNVVIAQTAPAVRVAIAEAFGKPAGTRAAGKMVAALRRLGFDYVLDTNFAADLTICEEAAELLGRIKNGGRLPILTSCCPAWVKFIEHQFPDLLDIPSTCKSPHEMFGAVAKTYLAEKIGVPPEKIKIVSIMPCLAKKFEASREELVNDKKLRDVDLVLSTREFARMIKEAGLSWDALPDEDFDDWMGQSSGAGVIFGTSGGVIEAAVRTAAAWANGSLSPEKIVFEQLRGMDGVREATVNIGGNDLKVAIAHGLGNARRLLDKIRSGEADWTAIEIMACPMGCVGGGGQPRHGNDLEILRKRAAAIYSEDESKSIRMSHENPQVQALYRDFLGKPNSELAHRLLHTHYTART